ncbi:hypothetical protein RRG08_018500 [Elysia crispata]|uniref:Uncharacterized protein n=1 Tax=Elysia crispata TaxID=231223 RepID=A0AAE0Y2R3_9GAST|nr:hypothetical protein RRG08_018500 [Elysia crispata]
MREMAGSWLEEVGMWVAHKLFNHCHNCGSQEFRFQWENDQLVGVSRGLIESGRVRSTWMREHSHNGLGDVKAIERRGFEAGQDKPIRHNLNGRKESQQCRLLWTDRGCLGQTGVVPGKSSPCVDLVVYCFTPCFLTPRHRRSQQARDRDRTAEGRESTGTLAAAPPRLSTFYSTGLLGKTPTLTLLPMGRDFLVQSSST